MTDTIERLARLERRVTELEIRVKRPTPAEVKLWIHQYYNGAQTVAAAKLGMKSNYLSQLCMGRKRPSDRIINQMIEDGFYGEIN